MTDAMRFNAVSKIPWVAFKEPGARNACTNHFQDTPTGNHCTVQTDAELRPGRGGKGIFPGRGSAMFEECIP